MVLSGIGMGAIAAVIAISHATAQPPPMPAPMPPPAVAPNAMPAAIRVGGLQPGLHYQYACPRDWPHPWKDEARPLLDDMGRQGWLWLGIYGGGDVYCFVRAY